MIPNQDVGRLKALGVSGVFPGGAGFSEIVAFINEHMGRA